MVKSRLPVWLPNAGLSASLLLAWLNFLLTGRWAALHGSLHGWKEPWYAAALLGATILTAAGWRHVGRPALLPKPVSVLLPATGALVIVTGLFSRLPLSDWSRIPFWDDWTPLFQEAVNGVRLLRHGTGAGWNWWFLGGYPTSTEIAQSFAALAFIPMQLFGDRIGFHLIHAMFFLAVPAFVWWDLRQEDRTLGWVAGGLACLFGTGFYGTLAAAGDTNSLAGVFSATLALFGSRAARLGRWWGGPALLLGLTLCLYSHVAFFIYALIFLSLEILYFRDVRAIRRLVIAVTMAGLAALPVHWESLRYPEYLRVNNTVYDPSAPVNWNAVAHALYYNVEMLAFPHRWFNDYRSLANVWWPAMFVVALLPGRSRVGFYAWAVMLAQGLLRLNTADFGVIFDRVQHMFPLLAAPALAGFVVRCAGTRMLAVALLATLGLYVQTDFSPIRHISEVRDFDPAFVHHLAGLDGNLVLVELSPHHVMYDDGRRRSPKTPFDAHFEGLLPGVAGQRFYGQMWDGWAWNVFRGQLVAAGTYAGRPIADTPVEAFEAEMRRWGVRHLLVWTDACRDYLARTGRFAERWRSGRWSEFELSDADVRSVATIVGVGQLRNLSFLGADVTLDNVAAGDPVIVRTNYYPAWVARTDAGPVPLYASAGQLAFRAPAAGSYVVHLEYPRRRWLSVLAICAFIAGCWLGDGAVFHRKTGFGDGSAGVCPPQARQTPADPSPKPVFLWKTAPSPTRPSPLPVTGRAAGASRTPAGS